MVSSEAAGALAAAAAACIAGSNAQKIWHVPDTTGLKHQVVIFGGRSAFTVPDCVRELSEGEPRIGQSASNQSTPRPAAGR